MAWFGIKCSSWVAMNRGTSLRSACDSVGNIAAQSVRAANMMADRRSGASGSGLLCKLQEYSTVPIVDASGHVYFACW